MLTRKRPASSLIREAEEEREQKRPHLGWIYRCKEPPECTQEENVQGYTRRGVDERGQYDLDSTECNRRCATSSMGIERKLPARQIQALIGQFAATGALGGTSHAWSTLTIVPLVAQLEQVLQSKDTKGLETLAREFATAHLEPWFVLVVLNDWLRSLQSGAYTKSVWMATYLLTRYRPSRAVVADAFQLERQDFPPDLRMSFRLQTGEDLAEAIWVQLLNDNSALVQLVEWSSDPYHDSLFRAFFEVASEEFGMPSADVIWQARDPPAVHTLYTEFADAFPGVDLPSASVMLGTGCYFFRNDTDGVINVPVLTFMLEQMTTSQIAPFLEGVIFVRNIAFFRSSLDFLIASTHASLLVVGVTGKIGLSLRLTQIFDRLQTMFQACFQACNPTGVQYFLGLLSPSPSVTRELHRQRLEQAIHEVLHFRLCKRLLAIGGRTLFCTATCMENQLH